MGVSWVEMMTPKTRATSVVDQGPKPDPLFTDRKSTRSRYGDEWGLSTYATIPVYYPRWRKPQPETRKPPLVSDSYNISLSCRNFIQDKAMTAFNNTVSWMNLSKSWCRCYAERAIYAVPYHPVFLRIGTQGSTRRCWTERREFDFLDTRERGRHHV